MLVFRQGQCVLSGKHSVAVHLRQKTQVERPLCARLLCVLSIKQGCSGLLKIEITHLCGTVGSAASSAYLKVSEGHGVQGHVLRLREARQIRRRESAVKPEPLRKPGKVAENEMYSTTGFGVYKKLREIIGLKYARAVSSSEQTLPSLHNHNIKPQRAGGRWRSPRDESSGDPARTRLGERDRALESALAYHIHLLSWSYFVFRSTSTVMPSVYFPSQQEIDVATREVHEG